MHQANWVHLDIKVENILLSEDGEPKLADFGMSRELTRGPQRIRRCGTSIYMVRTSELLIFQRPFERAYVCIATRSVALLMEGNALVRKGNVYAFEIQKKIDKRDKKKAQITFPLRHFFPLKVVK
jgi:serine/threonine protein kinase